MEAEQVHVRLAGEIDMSTRDAAYAACVVAPSACVVVDLSDVTFLDSAGALALFRARCTVRSAGGTLAVTGATAEPARLLSVLATIGEVELEDDTPWDPDWIPARLV